MTDSIRWGLIGLGSISRKFATGLGYLPDAEVYAVASRSADKADVFGAEFGATKCYGSYEALANDPDVDVVYIGTPHTYHLSNTLLCLKAGKHALCEKPFAVNRAQAQEMVDCARANKRFLMDAFWTRFFPGMVKLRELLADDVIGDVMLLQVDFGFRMGQILPEHRLFNPELGGGALLDVGVYCVQLASMVFGKQPSEILSQGTLGSTGVDELSATIFKYSDYELATIATAIRLNTPQEARIIGSKGVIALSEWWRPSEMTVAVSGQEPETLKFQNEGNGFNYEAAAVGDCIRSGLIECDVMPLEETLAIMDTMDRIRAVWGLRYPVES
ncbi:MAG: Gfo/Idh/MocA family oxidoreductase [Chloroflexota bacterium]|nr:Gfo/Idh/MocA family oxidoreductase [Chloroflexota bacterium]